MNKSILFCFLPKWKKHLTLILLLGISCLSISFIASVLMGPGLLAPQPIGSFLNSNLPSNTTGTPPQFLSQTGAFSNLSTLTPSSGVLPYSMIEPFWSDGADKHRWMAIPNNGSHNTANEKINFSTDGNWEFPIGTVLIKHFELGGKRLETRFEVRATNGSYYYLTYKWNSSGTDATLLTTGLDETIVVNGQAQVWHYPSPTECLDCHKQEVGSVLGPKTRNLNSSITYPSTGIEANQLVTLSHLGIIDESITDSNADNYSAVAAHDDLNYSLEYRARSYIDVNCSYCHQPATNVGQFDARITTPLNQQNIINGPVAYDIGLAAPSVIVPQNISQSVLHNRMNSLQLGVAMPPLAKNEIHQEGVQLIAEWINSISIDTSNTVPVALFSASILSGIGPLYISFDAANSYDPDLGDLVYSWDFGDEITATGVNVNHTYITPGTYEVTLTVNDGQNSGQKTVSIIVYDIPTNNSMVTFSDETDLLSKPNYSGVSMSVVDMNGDGRDDIVRYDDGKSLNIEYQQGRNQPFTSINVGAVSTEIQWSNTIADVNQDGFNDILTAGFYDEIKLYYNNGQSYNQTIIPNSQIFIQGSNFVDIDNDGWIDVFACYDHGDNREFRNLGNGTFTFSPNMINTETSPISDNSGNYSSIWTDYDNDGDIDLYISKCRSDAVTPTDPRRVNMLFQNDGNNNYTEVAADANLNIGAQSWLTDFADIDNDGDMDCIVINHYSVSNLMRNNGNGTFTDITNGSGLLPALNGRFGIQAFFRDFNNDGFVDLLVAGEKHCLFYNDGDGTFTQAPNPFNANEIKSLAIGDLNHDGFLDVYASYLKLFNTPTDTEDRLFLNNRNNNNFIAIQLEGVESNINGIGAKVKLFGTWGAQIREVRSGEGYGVMNSFTQHFGIGTATQISKVEVHWPSGTIDEIINPAPNQFLKIVEGNSTTNTFCRTDNFEPNNSFIERTDLGSGNTFNQSGLCITPGDEDYFIFSTDNETYFIQVRGANGTIAGEYGLSIERTGNTISIETQSVNQSTTDTYLHLYKDNLTILAENDNANNVFSKITYTIPGAGGGATVSCDGNTTIAYGDGEITMSGQTGQENYFQIFDLSWKEIYNCGWQCGNTKTVSNLTAGDYRIHIKNSDYQVICDKVITLSTGSDDPDIDGDGVPVSLDCDDTDPNLTTIGASCNDGNGFTVNDMVKADCTCEGTTTGSGTTIFCEENTTLTFSDGEIVMAGQIGLEYFFQVFDIDWNEIYNCGWQCGNTKTVSNLTAGDYRVYIKNSDYQVICDKVVTLSTGSSDPDNDGDGVPASIDCNDTDPNLTTIGANCNDGNVNTVNDLVQSNCTCLGTTPGGGNSTVVSCGDITVTYGEGIIDMVGIVGNSYFFKVSDLNNGWSQAFNCSWNCGYRQTAVDIPNGSYMVTINNEDWSEHCSVEIEMTNSSFIAEAVSRHVPQLNFEAFTANRTVDLQWSTNSGYKIKYFEIERSLDRVNFETLQNRINKKWSEQLVYHHTTDLIPNKGINYYRIKEVYLDNSFTYTDVEKVGFYVDIDELAIYPNPVENILRLNLKPIIGKKTKINILNAFGQVVQSYDFGFVNNEKEQIALNGAISNGFYHVSIEVEGERPIIRKLVVKRLY